MKNQKRKRRKRQYLVTDCRNGESKEAIMTKEAVNKLNPNDVDLQINEANGEVYIKPKKGKMKKYADGIPALGYEAWKLLDDIIWSLGDYVTLESANYVNALIRRIRVAFGCDSNKDQWFFKTRRSPYGIALNKDRSWRYIEVLAEADEATE